MPKLKWLWLWVLALLAMLASWIIWTAPHTARSASMHLVAATTGTYVGFALFATLIAALIKFLTSARWNLHQWANVVVVLTITVLIARESTAQHAAAQASMTPPRSTERADIASNGANKTMSDRLLGVWKCTAGKTRGSISDLMVIGRDGYVYSLSTGGGDGSPIYPSSWRVEGGSTYVHTLGGSPDNSYRGIVGRYQLSNVTETSVTFGDDDGFSCVRP